MCGRLLKDRAWVDYVGVGQARGLVPYAAFAVLLVGATVAALFVSTLGSPVGAPDTATPGPSASAAAAVGRAGTDLSPNGRLAYWRTEPNGEFLLWLANADNSRRRSVAASGPGAVARTKWALDGSAVGYVENGVRLIVVSVDGTKATYHLPADVRADGYRIVDHRFSPSGARVAATVQRQSGPQTDVYVAVAGGGWTRVTTTEDALAADWISEDELLVHTTGGIVGRLRATGRDQLRPLTGLAGATPQIGEDGRIYFLSGRISPFTGSSETFVSAASASVWSVTVTGDDLRRESATLGTDGFRLDGFWPGGGYLLHRGTNPAQIVMSKEEVITLPNTSGLIERLQVSLERRVGVGFAGTSLVRIDLGPSGTVANAVVLLGSVNQGDAWFPRAAPLAPANPSRPDVPPARYAFALGGHLWTMGTDGVPTILRAANTNAGTLRRVAVGPPRWSPAGDRVLTVESLAAGAVFQLVAVTIARDGAVRRYTTPSSVAPGVSWSPDGTQFAVVGLPGSSQDPALLASDLAVAVVDTASGIVLSTMPGREAYWTGGGIAVLSNGTFRANDSARDGQAVEIWSNGQRRSVATIEKLVATAPALAFARSAPRGTTLAAGIAASPDAAHLSLHLTFTTIGAIPAYVTIRTRDGAPTFVVTGDAVADEAWSPAGRHVGYTRSTGQGANAPRRAVVRDGETGDTLLDADGRFAGWSPDGAWAYVARSEGLYAKRLAGGDLVRFSPYGVPVTTTRP